MVLLSAACYGFCFPVTAQRWLAWGALAPFFVALRRAQRLEAAGLACAWTILATYVVADFLPGSVATYYQQSMWVGFSFFLGVALLAAPYVVGFAVCYRSLGRRGTPPWPWLAGATWATAEWGRSTFLTGNPWAVFGYSQAGVAPVVQIADLTGVYGVSFVLVAANAALAEAWIAARAANASRRTVRATVVPTVVVVALVLAYGFVRLDGGAAHAADGHATRIAIVQGNLDLGSQWQREFYGRN